MAGWMGGHERPMSGSMAYRCQNVKSPIKYSVIPQTFSQYYIPQADYPNILVLSEMLT